MNSPIQYKQCWAWQCEWHHSTWHCLIQTVSAQFEWQTNKITDELTYSIQTVLIMTVWMTSLNMTIWLTNCQDELTCSIQTVLSMTAWMTSLNMTIWLTKCQDKRWTHLLDINSVEHDSLTDRLTKWQMNSLFNTNSTKHNERWIHLFNTNSAEHDISLTLKLTRWKMNSPVQYIQCSEWH